MHAAWAPATSAPVYNANKTPGPVPDNNAQVLGMTPSGDRSEHQMAAIGTPPFHVLTKPIGPICNLDCKYCFYLEKEVLYPDTSKWAMPADVLESYIQQYIQQQNTD